jgi:hypothetical protein
MKAAASEARDNSESMVAEGGWDMLARVLAGVAMAF